VGMRNFFLSPQSQFRNLKEALFKEMLLRNSAIAIFPEVRNFKSATWELKFHNLGA
jgi:hypothetical protein